MFFPPKDVLSYHVHFLLALILIKNHLFRESSIVFETITSFTIQLFFHLFTRSSHLHLLSWVNVFPTHQMSNGSKSSCLCLVFVLHKSNAKQSVSKPKRKSHWCTSPPIWGNLNYRKWCFAEVNDFLFNPRKSMKMHHLFFRYLCLNPGDHVNKY